MKNNVIVMHRSFIDKWAADRGYHKMNDEYYNKYNYPRFKKQNPVRFTLFEIIDIYINLYRLDEQVEYGMISGNVIK
jgi:hypothetical protein